MEIAKETDLPDLLEHLGYQLKRVGSYYTTREMDSVRIKDRRTWKRYSNGKGGDAITFLQKFCGKDFRGAVNYLLEFNGHRAASGRSPFDSASAYGESSAHSRAPPFPIEPASLGFDGNPKAPTPRPRPAQQTEKPVFSLPAPNQDHRRVFAYLQKRGVAPQVIRGFVQAGLLYEDAEHHNCVFVGRDGDGKPRFANKRGTYDQNGPGFKGDVPGSDKTVAFRLPCDPALDWVAVFEVPIDLMSFCTLHRQVRSNAVALCGLYQGPLDTYLRENPYLKHIVLCLDADGPGREATEKFREEYAKKGYTVSTRTPAQGKDWNEYLQQRGQARGRGDRH